MLNSKDLEWMLTALYRASLADHVSVSPQSKPQSKPQAKQHAEPKEEPTPRPGLHTYRRVVREAQQAVDDVHHMAIGIGLSGAAAADHTDVGAEEDVQMSGSDRDAFERRDLSVDDDIFGAGTDGEEYDGAQAGSEVGHGIEDKTGEGNGIGNGTGNGNGNGNGNGADTETETGTDIEIDGGGGDEAGTDAGNRVGEAWGRDVFTVMGDFDGCAYSKHARELAKNLSPVVFVSVSMAERLDPANESVRTWLHTYPEFGVRYTSLPRVTVPQSYAPLWLDAEEQGMYRTGQASERGVFIGGADELQHFVSEMSLLRAGDAL